jgi:DNA repair protein RadC
MQSIPVYDVKLVRSRRPLKLAESCTLGPEQAARVIHAVIGLTDREHFVCLFLDVKKSITGVHIAHVGGQHTIGTIDARAILRAAIAACACAMIVGHNHPSGDSSPSREDRDCTIRLNAACDIVGVPLLDHIIVTRKADVYSSGWMHEEQRNALIVRHT